MRRARVLAGCVGRERYGLRERRNAQRRRQQAGEQTVDLEIYFETFFRDITLLLTSWVFSMTGDYGREGPWWIELGPIPSMIPLSITDLPQR